MRRVEQRWYGYDKWEDFKAGLYDKQCEYYDEKLNLSFELLGNPNRFYQSAKDCLGAWFYSSWQNLSDPQINHQAWIGQATCCYMHGAPSYVTIEAWWMLSDGQRAEANSIADKVMSEWQAEKMIEGSLWANIN